MAEGDRKTLNCRSGAEFLKAYRQLDARIDAAAAQESACVKAEDADGAGQAAAKEARLCHDITDLILHELERHWAPHVLDSDGTVPDFPDDWSVLFYGRILRIEYRERAAYKEQ